MRIVIVGAGNVGQALSEGWRRAGHTVSFAIRDGKSAQAVREAGRSVLSLAEAAANAEALVLALPWPAVPDALTALGRLDGKILIDATNPLAGDLALTLGFDDSGGETVARLAQGARVVKSLNTTGADNMAKARDFPVRPMMPVAADDDDARAVAMKLAGDLGFAAVDAGPLKASRLLEPMALFWIEQAMVHEAGRDFAFALTRR